jgi:glycosyltransferase involved in cell wall biosynthesis
MFDGKRVSVVLPTYNEKDSIRQCIRNFEALGVVDEIIVVNNNAARGTSDEVRGTSAREVLEPEQGYGAAILRGLRESTGDLVALCEPDATFFERDLLKMLEYSRDFDVVYGSRTMNELIWEGANMGFLLRYGNWGVAKLMEALFGTSSLSDVGCTFRLMRRRALELVLETCSVKENFFGPEMMIATIRGGLRLVQIPINYKERIGESMVTGDLWKAARLGVRMVGLILNKRFVAPITERLRR